MSRSTRGGLVGVVAAVVLLAVTGSALAAPPVSDRHRTGRGTSSSTNWSGYAAYGTSFSHVAGDWTVPEANCSGLHGQQTTIATAFVGLDGYLSGTVEQTGTDTDCIGTTPFYVAWYEFYPDRPVFLDQSDYPVDPGDRMHAEVAASGTRATLTLRDQGSAAHPKSWTLSPSPSLSSSNFEFSSAEWILEAPSNRLTNFGAISFSNAAATGGGKTNGAISDFTNDRITMVTKNGRTTRATPSALTGGDSFSVTFNHP